MVTINTEELFQTLAHAPIVEAVIDIRSRSAETLTEDLVRERVDPKIHDFAFLDSLKTERCRSFAYLLIWLDVVDRTGQIY